MRIGFDLHVVDGMFQGSRTHVIELFSRVAKLCPDFEFVALLDGVDRLKRDYPAFDLPNIRLERLKHTGAIRRLMWELSRMQRRLKLDLLHLQYIRPLPSFSPTVVTIHDVLFESHPEYFPLAFRLRSRLLMRLSAYRAKHVFTVSEFSKTEICTRYKLRASDVTVTHNSADFKRFFPGSEGEEFLSARGLSTGNYFLSIALDSGYVGLALFVLVLVVFSFKSPIVAVKNPGHDGLFVGACLASVLAIAATFVGLSIINNMTLLWLLIAATAPYLASGKPASTLITPR